MCRILSDLCLLRSPISVLRQRALVIELCLKKINLLNRHFGKFKSLNLSEHYTERLPASGRSTLKAMCLFTTP